jgi:hypothetical protein
MDGRNGGGSTAHGEDSGRTQGPRPALGTSMTPELDVILTP